MTASRCLGVILLAGLSTSLFPSTAPYRDIRSAIPAPFVPDDELAVYPIVVVARWNKADFEQKNKIEGGALKEWELHTEIAVERVIAGDLKAGAHKISLGSFIGWQKNGGQVVSYMSTEQVGDVEEVCDTNLWFLGRKCSWDEGDKTDYLYLDTFRGVQPLVLEKYFAALRSKDAKSDVPKLLDSNNALVVERVLEFIAGGRLPWPFEPWEFIRPKETKKPPLAGETSRVSALIESDRDSDTRALAVAVYAELVGKKALPRLRDLLKDRHIRVQAVAAGLLAEHRDDESIDPLTKAATTIASVERSDETVKEAEITCDLISRCAAWGDLRLIPVVIPFLQNDAFVCQCGDDLGIPAFKARDALMKLTGVEFPLDVSASVKAWESVRGIKDKTQCLQQLAELLRSAPIPLAARMINPEGKLKIVVTNISKHPVLLATKPSSIEMRYSGGLGSRGGWKIDGKEAFKELAPGDSIAVPLSLSASSFSESQGDSAFESSFLAAEPSTRRAMIRFLRNGNEFGVKAWMGNLQVTFAEGWNEPNREMKIVEEHWKNGRLRAKGPMLNGKRHGTWTFYREDGKRIREDEYFNGNICKSTEFNPDYDDKKDK